MWKIVSLIFLFQLIVGTFAQKIVICQVNETACVFRGKSIAKDQQVVLLADHATTEDSDIKIVRFEISTIYAIPPNLFTTFENLETLEISGQKVQEILPDTFVNAGKLKHLDLSKNLIYRLEANTFHGANGLLDIQLHSNQIEELDKDSLVALNNLEVLHLYNNKIGNVHRDTFRDLFNLRVFHLDFNKLEFIHKRLLINNLNLYEVYLSGNSMNAISNRMFSHLRKLNLLFLNPNNCIEKDYSNAKNKFATIENDLRNCSVSYLIQENDEIIGKVDNLGETFERDFSLLSERVESKFGGLQEDFTAMNNTMGSLIEKINQMEAVLESLVNPPTPPPPPPPPVEE